jgi:hypothetical protein
MRRGRMTGRWGRFIVEVFHCAGRIAAPVLLVIALAACGDQEQAQRKAFIGFLEDINSRQGVHVLKPSAKDETDFGPYLQHYVIILDYNGAMAAASDDFAAQIRKLGVGPTSTARTLEQMAAAPQDLTVAKDEVQKVAQAAEARLAEVNARRNALHQPDDLKAVYDKTFDRLITAPTAAF